MNIMNFDFVFKIFLLQRKKIYTLKGILHWAEFPLYARRFQSNIVVT